MAVANHHTASGRLVGYALLLLCAAVTLMPFLYLVCSAVKTRATFFLVAFSAAWRWLLGHRLEWSYPGTFLCVVH